MNESSKNTSDQPHDVFSEEEYQQHSSQGQKRKESGTPISTWVAVFGSSTVFHVLLLILLGMIIISQPKEEQELVTLQIPEEEEEQQKKITRREVEKEVENETEMTEPTVETTEEVSEVQSEMQSETGQSLDFTSDSANKSPVERSIALGGGGGGGTYGNRGGEGISSSGGGGSTVERRAVKAALIWLARHQSDGGFWEPDKDYTEQCPEGNKCETVNEGKDKNKVGVTGLSMLAFLGAGYTHESDKKLDGIDVGKVLRNSLRWLKDRQKGNGAFDDGDKQIYNHSIASMAYAEAYGMTGDPKLKRIAQEAIEFLEHAQNTSGGKRLGWRYEANSGSSDTSVTGWAAMALKSAELAGLDTSEETLQGALRWVEQNTNKKGLTGYNGKISSRSDAEDHRAMTPVGMLIRMFAHEEMNREQLKMLKRGSDFLVNRVPKWVKAGGGQSQMDYYYWYYGSLALYMFAGPGTELENTGYWQKWNQPMKKAVLSGQQSVQDGHEVGSWDPVTRWARGGDRVYTTALNALTLEVYYRYDNALFQ